jgi:hypothetical protein
MPARDRYHDAVKNALVKDGWTITDDPLHLVWGKKDLYADLGAERLLGAAKGTLKIAVEIKSFAGRSELRDLQQAVGQYVMYHEVLQQTEPDRKMFLAVRDETWEQLFEEPIGKLLIEKQGLHLLVFDEDAEVISKWIPETAIAGSSRTP